MMSSLWDLLVKEAQPEELEKLSPRLRESLGILSTELTAILGPSDEVVSRDLLSRLSGEILAHLPELEARANSGDRDKATGSVPEVAQANSWRTKIPPEILEWAKQDLNEEDILAGIREINETGGLQLADFIQELEQIVKPRE